jgi:hypothetical protein
MNYKGKVYTAKEDDALYRTWASSGVYQNLNTIGNSAYVKDSAGKEIYHLRCIIYHDFSWRSDFDLSKESNELLILNKAKAEKLTSCIEKGDLVGAIDNLTPFNANSGFIHLFAKKGNVELLGKLLQIEKSWPFDHGRINWNARDSTSRTVVDIAKEERNEELASTLLHFIFPKEEGLSFEPVLTCKVCGFSPTGLVCSFQVKNGVSCLKPLRVRIQDGALVCPEGHGGILPPECCHRVMSVKPQPEGFIKANGDPGSSYYTYSCSECKFGVEVAQMRCVGCSTVGTAFNYNHAVERIWSARAYACNCRRGSSGGQIGGDPWPCVCQRSSLHFPPVDSYY